MNNVKKWDAEQRRRITLGVLQKLYAQLASNTARGLENSTDSSMRLNLVADAASLEGMIALIKEGEDLQTTRHRRLALMRDLVIGGLTNMLPDGEYVLTDFRAWFTCGPASVRITKTQGGEGIQCSVYPLMREDCDSLATCYASYSTLRQITAEMAVSH